MNDFSRINCKRLVDKLSDREREVLQLMSLGLATKEIADRLALAQPTVCVYRERIYSKLAVNSIAPAVRVATLAGVL